MPVGTPVLAVRDGTVMDVEEDFNRGGADREKFLDKANHVRILHEDGTMTVYAHLDMASVSVRRGAGAGRANLPLGNTAQHRAHPFAIQQNVGMEIQSVPFRFFSQWRRRSAVEKQVLGGILPSR
jgi:hypothetical protein